MNNKIGDNLAYRIEILSEHKERTRQQERLLNEYMRVARMVVDISN